MQEELPNRTDQLFREAGIVIAFPQRDVHLDGVKLIDVRRASDAKTSPEPES